MLGLIGCGRRGTQLIEAAGRTGEIAFSMVCDVDLERANTAAKLAARTTGSRPATAVDYRDVLDDKAVEGVIIATPDHWHVVQFLAACEAEKDIYIEVPVAPTLLEAEAMTQAARQHKRVVQVGLQLRSSRYFREAGMIANSGQLGRVAQTRTWSFARQSPIDAKPDGTAPANLNYDAWLGPAPEAPYNPNRIEHADHFWAYGGGEAARWNIHLQDLMAAAMRVTVPTSVVAVGGNHGLGDARETPDTLDVLFEYKSPRGDFTHAYSLRLSNAYAGWGPAGLPPLDGNPILTGDMPARSGVQFFGRERTLFTNGQRLLMLPASDESPVDDLQYLGIGSSREPSAPQPAPETPDSLTVEHIREFGRCIRTRRDPSATVEFAEVALFPVLAANIACRVGRKLYINLSTKKFFTDAALTNADEEADKLLIPTFRKAYLPKKT